MAKPLIFDADAHVTETPDVWVDRMSEKKWGNLIPHVEVIDGKECWVVGDKNMGLVTSASFIRVNPDTGERYRQPPSGDFFSGTGFSEIHPASYDPVERLKAMDEWGVQAAVLYPNLNLVINDLHEQVDDPQYKIEVIRAYNDWLIEWTKADPNRLIPSALVAYFDPHVAAEEIYRSKEIGHRGLIMTGVPHLHDLPPLADASWEPLWTAAEDTGLSIGFHVGANAGIMEKYVNRTRLAAEGPLKMGARMVTASLLDNAGACNDLLISGVLPKHPGLKFVMVETGLGWVNFALESADYHFARYGVGQEHEEFTEPPSYYFHRQVLTTYWFETLSPFYLEKIGEKNIMFETDFPHSTSLDPGDVRQVVEEGLAQIPEQARERILWGNAADLYNVPTPATV